MQIMKEAHPWIEAARSMSMPLKSGISGTTSRAMQAAEYLKISAPATHVRMACLGFLLPINAHSYHEVMAAASGYAGWAYTPGDYRSIAPMGEAEVRKAGGGKFPDEA